ncbi:hypothetical protein EAO75_14110 [Streptomyces sp. uw30]|uniref:hypothetical protein n=1 Tax=Streptomyces sp. uw30 TaxID=1828179 RepID=UPI0011CE0F45|nr:hypothetical protein [Streptomyces sp. uw30]TXS49824.1 hypothetical protein EAO75_14110 [Streptomyces sp. uw30]
MGISRAALSAGADAATSKVSKELSKKVAAHAPHASIEQSLALRPEPRAVRLSRLFDLVTGDPPVRMARILELMDVLHGELRAVMARIPLRPLHFGFKTVEEMVQYIGEVLFMMETSAASPADFVAGIDGWRRNLVGRILFERLVKYHPRLDAFFRGLAKDLVKQVNAELAASRRALVDARGKPRRASPTFGEPEKVIEFRLVGGDGIERAFTDAGFLATNREGRRALLPLELKMPAALQGVAAQFDEFLSRLQAGEELIVVVERNGALVRQPVDPDKLLFMAHDRAQVAVAPLSVKAAERLAQQKKGPVQPDEVARVVDFEPKHSESRQLSYYVIRLLVLRDWLEEIARPITDPPKR